MRKSPVPVSGKLGPQFYLAAAKKLNVKAKPALDLVLKPLEIPLWTRKRKEPKDGFVTEDTVRILD